MKKMMIFACAMLFAVAAQAQWDLEGLTVDKSKWVDYAPTWNPDPYIMTPGAGSIGSVRQNTKLSNGRGPRKAPQKAEGATDLPEYWDNANTKHFPPVFNQDGGSCGVSSRAGYMLCEELNAYRGTDASHPDNRLSPNIQHPYDNTGPNKNTMAYQIGFPSMSTYGGFPSSNIYGSYGPTSNNAGWMTGYDRWYKTMHNRIWGASSIPSPVIGYPEENPEGWGRGGFGPGAIAAKRWLYNHNGDESFHTGGMLGLGVASGGHVLNIPSSAENRKIGLVGKKYWVTGTSVDHAVSVSGYDDRVEFDLDGNGKVGERKNSDGLDEKGAWIIVNSWGGWANNGFIYVPYALATPTCQKNSTGKGFLPVGSGFTPEMWHIRKDYTPARTIKVKISFTQRSAISLKAGISTNLKAASPQKTLLFEHFSYKGDGDGDGKDAMTPMLGRWNDGVHYEPMELGFDLSDLLAEFDPTQPLKFFFIVDSKSTATGVGGIHEASIIDYTCDPNGIETAFVIEGDSITIGNKGKSTKISTIVYGEAINPPTNLKISGTTLSWEAPQTNFKPVGYIVYKNGEEIAQTEGNVTSYNVGTGEGTYTVKTIYEFNGQRKLSAASASVEGNYAFSKRYITKIGTAISKVSDLKDGMTVILYNTGRQKYVCDTGDKIYQHKSAAPKKGDANSGEYVFTVHKVGNTFTFTSENGSLPAFVENNVSIPVSDTPGQFTVTGSSSSFLLKNGSWYLNGNENVPVTWNAGDNNSQHRITPVECNPEIQGLDDYTTVTLENLMEGQIVALYNNGRGYFVTDEGGSYGASKAEPTAESYNYLFRVGKNADGTFTFTSENGAIPVLPYNATFAPSNTAENFTLTSAGTGLFYLQGATAVASAGGQQERQYLNGNETAPVGWNSEGTNSAYRLYPVKTSSTAPNITISASTPIQVFAPVQLRLTGDADIASCVWKVEDKTYTSVAPTVVFTSEGSKTIECTAVNMRGMSKTVTKTLTVQAAPELSADFSVSKTTIAGGEPVSFHATNQMAGCNYHWDFPGTQQVTAETRNVSVVYLATGEHQVTLTVTAPDGRKATKTETIIVQQVAPAPDFTLSETVIMKGESVTVTDKTLYGPTAWTWTLLEEKNRRYQSTDQNPTFTPAAGRYNLHVTATNEVGSGTLVQKRALLVCNAPSLTGLEFAGGNNRVTTNLEGITSAWTIDFWMNPRTLEASSVGIFGSNDLKLTSNDNGAVTLTRGTTKLSTSADNYYLEGEWHHYAITYGNAGRLPYPSEFTLAENIRFYAKNHATGLFFEHENPDFNDFYDCKVWLEAKLMEDPSRDADALMRDFCEKVYGKAAEYVLNYRRGVRDAARRNHAQVRYFFPNPEDFRYLDWTVMKKSMVLYEQALAAVKSDSSRMHQARRAFMSLDFALIGTMSWFYRIQAEDAGEGALFESLRKQAGKRFLQCYERSLSELETKEKRIPAVSARSAVEFWRQRIAASDFAPLPRVKDGVVAGPDSWGISNKRFSIIRRDPAARVKAFFRVQLPAGHGGKIKLSLCRWNVPSQKGSELDSRTYDLNSIKGRGPVMLSAGKCKIEGEDLMLTVFSRALAWRFGWLRDRFEGKEMELQVEVNWDGSDMIDVGIIQAAPPA